MAELKDTITEIVRSGSLLTARQIGVAMECADRKNAEERQVKTLALHFNISKPAITRAADALVAEGMVKREALAGDKRACVLTMTTLGERTVKAWQRGKGSA